MFTNSMVIYAKQKLIFILFIRMLCADLKFCSAFLGHKGAASLHPCMLCESWNANKVGLGLAKAPLRTLERMRPSIMSFDAIPLLSISPADIVPPSMHLLSGVAMRTIEVLERMATEAEHLPELCAKFFQLHTKRDPRTRQFRGLYYYLF